ncbi:cytochrome P450 [Amylostereum chailletii]|nr:cytochrome P450 [Amylostereum chailletii]
MEKIARGADAKNVKEDCAILYATATDTITSSILTFVLAMLHSPEVQKKAQEELSRVTGGSRLPTFEDRANLPYITAIMKESLRWEAVIPLGVPHVLREDDTYDGYLIPAGTTMLANQWAMSHDASEYHDPMSFNPDRFLQSTKVREPNTIAFGWGKRICPGRFVAENSLWLYVATILTCFDIQSVDGVVPQRKYTSGLASRPMPFQCHFIPRKGSSELIEDSVAALG